MAILNILSTAAPIVGGISFDAVLEDTFEAGVLLTNYPIESGALASDHRIIQPYKWSIVGIMSNSPLTASAGDFVGGLASNFISDSGVAAAAAGLSAGLLAGGNDGIAGSSLNQLLTLMVSNTPFTVEAGDITLTNMVITKITRTKTPANENGLEFEAQLQELPRLSTIVSGRFVGASQDQLAEGDPARNQAATLVDKGKKLLLGFVPVIAAAALAAVLKK